MDKLTKKIEMELRKLQAASPKDFEVVSQYVHFLYQKHMKRAKADASKAPKKKAGRNV